MEVMEIGLNMCGPASNRQLAIIDKNRDLYLTPIRHFGAAAKLVKLGKQPVHKQYTALLIFLLKK